MARIRPAARPTAANGGVRPGAVLWRGSQHRITVGKRYSRFVGLMRFVLPATAGLVIALIVVWPQVRQATDGFKLDMHMLRLEQNGSQNLVNPRYTSADQNDRPFGLTAARAVQGEGGADVVLLDQPQAEVRLGGDAWMMMTAENGRFDRVRQTLELDGGVAVFHDDGHAIRSEHAVLDIATGDAFGEQPVSAHGPNGELTAAGFQIHDRGRQVFFLGPSRLVIRPAAPAKGGGRR